MSTSTYAPTERDVALQKIGRNLVNFQKLEAMLKFVLAFSDVSGPASELDGRIADRLKENASRPMGEVVLKAARQLHSTAEQSNSEPESVEEIRKSHKFTIGETSEERSAWRTQMNAVVQERNKLVHHMLVGFDPQSDESCIALSKQLDAQRELMLPAYAHIEALVVGIREFHADLAKHADEIASAISEAIATQAVRNDA